ncbi:4-(cytidine 5'-diphospho)-2-C-methyl-D-erythritol kinase [Desulfuribacillus alkaliarsenatis]|uniref:4-diphosphocytidyl-2-C-methyl-D-erythritol kinase n=1 Tax=Desulfuribacillus alkaliarsenatis TaxID=766136 RepID=A0A1E5FYV5_9FIRM|nr:4-(cytidine 5'-diphospho)-2-C-methyl-D-erythritol kinase [Desulfuribacillus alkaliarsenatis]OEF95750.1 4-(cytidine 5'-diphospho)-2-C-methyl-D-erythritol kinase [Desulfuribacillus alkaliarsenatis]
MKITELAKAKINLTLDILGKRSDGYHEVEMMMQTVDLTDQMIFTLRQGTDITIECDVSYVPTDERNLAYKAAKLLQDRFSVNKGVHIMLHKKIPVSAGLAGGSSNAAATLRGLNQLWELNLTTEEMVEIAAEIGSDVAFCVYGSGTAIARGRGEIIERIPKAPPMTILLVKPQISVSTAVVYQNYRSELVKARPNTKAMLEAINEQDQKAICDNLSNVLETVTFSMHPEVQRLKQQMLSFGADGVLMSGSGPTVYGIVLKEKRATKIFNALRGFCNEVFLVRTC